MTSDTKFKVAFLVLLAGVISLVARNVLGADTPRPTVITERGEDDMKLVVVGDKAFYPLSDEYLVCIGDAKIVVRLSHEEIAELVKAVLETLKYEAMDGEGQIVH